MFISSIAKMFDNGNVCVTGLRGTGKDLLFGNVINYRKQTYVSTIDYGGDYCELNFDKINCAGNTYKELIEKNVFYYEYPYKYGADVYLSDAGIYFPSQFNGELNKRYQGISTYQALSRQLSGNNFHVNVQNLNRVWDKIREQSDTYIRCRKCIYLWGLVIQFITIYDKAESCVNRVKPCRIKVPFFNPQARTQADCYIDNFYNQHGKVQNKLLIYINRSKHDTLYFRELLKNGKKQNN